LPPSWTSRCIPNASPVEPHAPSLVAIRVKAASGALTTIGSRTMNDDLSQEEVNAALTHYRRHKKHVDARILLNEA
jgi:hypothetical protein